MKQKGEWNKETIIKARQSLGLTQKDLAIELGTTQQRISEWECGVHEPKNCWQRLLTIHFKEKGIVNG